MRKIKSYSLILIAVIMCFALAGCSSLSIFNSGADAQAVVEGFLSAVSKDDTDKAKTFLVEPNSFETLSSVSRQLGMNEDKTKKFVDQYTDFDFSVEKTVTENADKASVLVLMTVPDYSAAFAEGLNSVNQGMNSGQALKTIVEKMADTKPETVEKAVAVTVVKNGDNWLIDYSNNNIELLNALNGNVLNALHGSLAM